MKEINIIWNELDIDSVDSSLTKNQRHKVLDLLLKNHDANIGINWDVVEQTIKKVKKCN